MMEKKKGSRKSGNRRRTVAFAAAAACILVPTSTYAVSGVSGLFEKARDIGMDRIEFDVLYNNLSSAGYDVEQIADVLEPKTNESGQTYGAEWLQPDLILVELKDGTTGYCYDEDLNGKKFSTPEEALAWQEQCQREFPNGREIPVYERDGKTVIGYFKLGDQ